MFYNIQGKLINLAYVSCISEVFANPQSYSHFFVIACGGIEYTVTGSEKEMLVERENAIRQWLSANGFELSEGKIKRQNNNSKKK